MAVERPIEMQSKSRMRLKASMALAASRVFFCTMLRTPKLSESATTAVCKIHQGALAHHWISSWQNRLPLTKMTQLIKCNEVRPPSTKMAQLIQCNAVIAATLTWAKQIVEQAASPWQKTTSLKQASTRAFITRSQRSFSRMLILSIEVDKQTSGLEKQKKWRNRLQSGRILTSWVCLEHYDAL